VMGCLRRGLADMGVRIPRKRRATGLVVVPHLLPQLVNALQIRPDIGRVRFQLDSRGRSRVSATNDALLRGILAELEGGAVAK
jgi:hypothetical protein